MAMEQKDSGRESLTVIKQKAVTYCGGFFIFVVRGDETLPLTENDDALHPFCSAKGRTKSHPLCG